MMFDPYYISLFVIYLICGKAVADTIFPSEVDQFLDTVDCGRKNNETVNTSADIEEALRSEYPWLVSIYEKRSHLGVGTLISRRLTITTAYILCEEDSVTPKPAKNIKVGLGKYYYFYDDPRDTDAKYLEVSDVIVFDGYKGINSGIYGDIGFLVTKKPVEFTKWIKPVCIKGIDKLQLQEDDIGIIYGYSNKYNTETRELMALELNYRTQNTCFKETPHWLDYLSQDLLCGLAPNRTAFTGDNGTGWWFENPENGRYYVHGVLGLIYPKEGISVPGQNSAYVNLTYHYDYIMETLSRFEKATVDTDSSSEVDQISDITDCGRKNNETITTSEYNEDILRSEYPWLVTIYEKRHNVGVGNLISTRLIITTAYNLCGRGSIIPKPAKNFKVGLGKYYKYYGDPRDPDANYLEVSEVIVFDGYEGLKDGIYGDIGFLVTKKPVEFTKWIKPVCIKGIDKLQLQEDDIGIIYGYSNKYNNATKELVALELNYRTLSTCFKETPHWLDYLTQDLICGRAPNRTAFTGDGGTGWWFKNPENGRYYVHGVLGLVYTKKEVLVPGENNAYVNLKYHYDYIMRVLERFG